jgi:hypothetical protein
MRKVMKRTRWPVVFAFLLTSPAACGGDGGAPSSVAAPEGVAATPSVPSSVTLQRVEVTTVTTGVHLDPDGYGLLNDEWDYDIGDGATVAAPTNGTTVLYLRPGNHVLSVVDVAKNCRGENLSDRAVVVPLGALVTTFEFRLTCAES